MHVKAQLILIRRNAIYLPFSDYAGRQSPWQQHVSSRAVNIVCLCIEPLANVRFECAEAAVGVGDEELLEAFFLIEGVLRITQIFTRKLN